MLNANPWIHQIKTLPVLPQVTLRITERIQSPTATLSEISELIKSDLGLASKILKLANSSYYSIPGGVSDIPKALQYLGFNTIAQIVLTTSIVGTFKNHGLALFPLTSFWKHSFAVGLLSEITAKQLHFKNPSEFFMGGLMHDLGKLILLEIAPDELTKILHLAKEQQISFSKAEKSLQLPTHLELGVALAHHWNLPKGVIHSIEHHHGGASDKESLLIEWANAWVNLHNFGFSGNFNSKNNEAETELRKKLGLTQKSIELIENTFNKDLEKAGALLNGN